MKISVVDDIKSEREELCGCLREWSGEKGADIVIESFERGEDFIKSCSSVSDNVPDIVFMDIYIGEENGLDIVAELRKITTTCVVIFITTSREDALRVFPLHPFDYVVKPWKRETIFRVMDEAAELCERSEKRLELTVGRRTTLIPISRILYAISDDHHVKVVVSTGEEIKSFSTFSEVSEKLLCDRRFLVCNRGIIVNMDHIDKIAHKCFVMKNGDNLPLKIKEIPALEKAFAEYIFSRAKRW